MANRKHLTSRDIKLIDFLEENNLINKVQKIELQGNITKIGERAFDGCNKIKIEHY